MVGHLTVFGSLAAALGTGQADGVVIAVLVIIGLASGATAVLRPQLRPLATASTALALVWALWLSGGLVGPRPQWALLAAAALALAALA